MHPKSCDVHYQLQGFGQLRSNYWQIRDYINTSRMGPRRNKLSYLPTVLRTTWPFSRLPTMSQYSFPKDLPWSCDMYRLSCRVSRQVGQLEWDGIVQFAHVDKRMPSFLKYISTSDRPMFYSAETAKLTRHIASTRISYSSRRSPSFIERTSGI